MDLPNDEEVLAQLLREADFYQIEELIRLIETKQRKMRRTIVPIQRENLLLMLHSTSRLQLPSTCLMGMCTTHALPSLVLTVSRWHHLFRLEPELPQAGCIHLYGCQHDRR